MPVKLCSSFLLVSRTMQGLLVLRFYHADKTDKMDCFIHDSGKKNGRKDKQSCQKADVCILVF